jgi:glycine cleavage system H protein
MTKIQGCQFPDDLYYLVQRHVWVQLLAADGSLLRMGITPVGFKLAGGKIIAVTPRSKSLGQIVPQGRAVAMLESNKYVGAIQAPVTATLLRVNPAVVEDPKLAVADPYGAGWIAELQPADWASAQASLLTGPAAIAAYGALLEEENISCE